MRASEIEELLPAVYRRAVRTGTPLRALLEVMEALHAPDEQILAGLPSYLNPYSAPDEMVPFLATWVDLGWLLPARAAGQEPDDAPLPAYGLGRLRELVAAAPELSRWRGTAQGLVQFLETATGVRGFKVYEGVTTTLKFSRSDTCQEPAKIAAGTRVTVERTDATGERPVFITAHNATLPACEKPANEESVDVVAYFCEWVDGELVCAGSPAADVPAKALTVLKDPIAGVDVTNTEPARIRPFHIVVGAPAGARPYRALVRQIVETEKPAYMTHDIVWPENSGARE